MDDLTESSEHQLGSVGLPIKQGALGFLLGTLLLLVTVSAGCSPLVDSDQSVVQPDLTLQLRPDHDVGQTFVAHHGGLREVRVRMSSSAMSEGEIVFYLRSAPESSVNLRTVTLSASQLPVSGEARFSFPPLQDSHGAHYYAVWTLAAPEDIGSVEIAAGPADTYLNGAAYANHQPREAQLAFGLAYGPFFVGLDLLSATVKWAGWLLCCALLFALLGYVLLRSLGVIEGLTPGTVLGLSVGIGLSIYPVLLVWSDAVGFSLGRLNVWLPVLAAVATGVLILRGTSVQSVRTALRGLASGEVQVPDIVLLLVIGLVFAVRLVIIRTLDAPLWGDSVQHATIVQLMLDNGGLFSSWEPYASFDTFTVHFGFHSVTAAFVWLTGMGATQATLVMGQLLNGMSILTLYPLAERLAGGRRWAGVGAVLAAGLLSPMPGYYVNWGRYAQLAGQTILPVALWLFMEALQRRTRAWQLVVVAGFVLSGMALSYYRAPFYYAVFALVWVLGWVIRRVGGVTSWRDLIVRLVGVGASGLLLSLPWLVQVASHSQLAGYVEAGLTADFPLTRVLQEYEIWKQIYLFVPAFMLVMAGVSIVWSLVVRKYAVILILAWAAGLALLPAAKLLNLPMSNMLDNFAVLIALYMPVSLAIGFLFDNVSQVWNLDCRAFGRWLMAGIALAVGIWGAREQMSILDLAHALVTRSDVKAMDWIADNTPDHALFLVEGFSVYNGHSVVGADAGWWIPMMAGRRNTIPPQYALLSEHPADPRYATNVVDIVNLGEAGSLDSTEAMRLLCELGVTHAYVGQRQGLVGAGVRQLYSAESLSTSASFGLLHQLDRARIYSFDRGMCVVP